MKLETQVWGNELNRRADIGTVLGKYHVILWENDEQVRVVDVSGHSASYAHDVGENWVMGIIEE